jgi:alcohol dehydrogenase (NADP+)
MKSENEENARRTFVKQSAILGVGAILAGSGKIKAFGVPFKAPKNIATKGYAGTDATSPLRPWTFERRPVGDHDILIDIKFSGICHSDIHTIRGHWGPQTYPQVVGHEIAGIVTAVGKNVTKFKVGDKAGVGCMVDSCMQCGSCKKGEEHHCETTGMLGTYGAPDKTSPTGITQGGYSNNLVVRDHFAIKIPESIDLQHAAPLLCAGITTYSPIMQVKIKRGDKVGIIGIGGLGHIAIKLAVSKGAQVYAFTTSENKRQDILSFGAKEVIVVDSLEKLKPYIGKLDYMLSTVPYDFDMSAYANCVKPYGTFTQVGMPVNGELKINNFLFVNNRVNFNASMIGGIPETQDVINYCAQNKILPEIQIIPASQINEAWDKVVNKEARYRYVIDAATF